MGTFLTSLDNARSRRLTTPITECSLTEPSYAREAPIWQIILRHVAAV